jgi:hypothetical protein
MNLSNWRHGGFQDWLNEQQRLEGVWGKRKSSLEFIQASLGSTDNRFLNFFLFGRILNSRAR